MARCYCCVHDLNKIPCIWLLGEHMRSEITFPARIVRRGNGFFIPVLKSYVETMELSEGDDVDIVIRRPKTENGE